MIALVDHLGAQGWMTDHGGTWRLTAARATIEHAVPDNLRQLIEGQLRFASAEERDALEVASVADVAFDAPAVAAGPGVRWTAWSPYATASVWNTAGSRISGIERGPTGRLRPSGTRSTSARSTTASRRADVRRSTSGSAHALRQDTPGERPRRRWN